MKTTMQELIEKIQLLNELDGLINPIELITTIAERMLEQEKKQIKDAYNQGILDGESSMLEYPKYYNQTYN